MDTPHAHIEMVSGVIRVFDPGKKFGDPYAWAATIQRVDHETVEILGVDKKVLPSQWRAIKNLLIELGYKKCIRFVAGRRKALILRA